VTGYAALELEYGAYLVIKEHNKDKVVAPVHPFYITLPVEDRHMVVKAARSADAQPVYYDIISIYPKNEPVKPPEDTPDLPDPPGNVSGRFTVVKHDEENGQIRLEGAQFKVFRAAGPDDTNTQNVTCEGMQYAVVPVRSGGGDLVLTTGSDGTASSPALPCGVYFLLETKAPDGYYGFTEAVSVTVVSDSVSDGAYVYVSNRRGSMLPSTGGPGVEGLIALGLMLTLCTAAALAFTAGRRREA
jgi:hypothetical protein